IRKLALSSESVRVAAGLSDGTVWLWDSGNGELIDRLDGFECEWWHDQLQFSPTGTRLAYSSADGIKLRDGISGRFIADLRCGSSNNFEFSGDGSRIASLSGDDRLRLWNSETGALIVDVSRNATAVTALALSRDCSRLACGYRDGTVELWGTSPTKRRIASHQAHRGSVRALGFGPDGGLFASGSDGTIQLWNGGDGALHGTLDGPSGLGSVALS
ncbi:hypothetical protein M378DRAFT_54012, partial [Amanita muscaria Koide BX008]